MGYVGSMINSTDQAMRKLNVLSKSQFKDKELIRFKILQNNARNKGIRLELCPSVYERHKKNISFYYMKEKQIFWNFEICFVTKKEAESRLASWDALVNFTDPISETELLSAVFEQVDYVDPLVQNFFGCTLTFAQMCEILVQKQYVLMIEHQESNSRQGPAKQMQSIEPTMTIDECLRNRTLIEFPTIFVVKAKEAEAFKTGFRKFDRSVQLKPETIE